MEKKIYFCTRKTLLNTDKKVISPNNTVKIPITGPKNRFQGLLSQIWGKSTRKTPIKGHEWTPYFINQQGHIDLLTELPIKGT